MNVRISGPVSLGVVYNIWKVVHTLGSLVKVSYSSLSSSGPKIGVDTTLED